VLRDDVPSVSDMANPADYFPYRYGHAFTAYIGGKYGDQAVTNLFKRAGQVGLEKAFTSLYGIEGDSLAAEWAVALEDAYRPLMEGRTPPDSAGREVLSLAKDAGRTNIAPRLSPDGRYVAFISERDVFQFSLYVADAETGEVIDEVDATGLNPHFDALRFINSAGAWSPDGRRLAFVSFEGGDNRISIWNVQQGGVERNIEIAGVEAMKNPAWSPDGTRLAVSGVDGGLSDLYVVNLRSDNVRQYTNDRYADLQPTWSPDGQTIAVTTDRGALDLETLDTGMNLGFSLIDAETGDMRTIRPFQNALNHNPQFSPDGRSLYFISTHDGFKDIYRVALRGSDDAGQIYRVTRLKTGVSGITALSPAMSVARQNGGLAFSVFYDNKYTGYVRRAAEAQGEPMPGVTMAAFSLSADATPRKGMDENDGADDGTGGTGDAAGIDEGETDDDVPSPAITADAGDDLARLLDRRSPPADTTTAAATDTTRADTTTTGVAYAGTLPPAVPEGESLIGSLLGPETPALPPDTYDAEDYDPTISLEGIAPPSVGVSVGGPLGTRAAGGVAFRFGDLLGNQTLTAVAQLQGRIQDFGAQVSYVNRAQQLNWGGTIGRTPQVFSQVALGPDGETLNRVIQRISYDRLLGLLSYPVSRVQRFELSGGAVRYGFDADVQSFDVDTGLRLEDDLSADELSGALIGNQETEYFALAEAAYVLDFTTFGLTSPVQGGRARISLSPRVGTTSFVTARLDARRYFYTKPFTFALQAIHVGNYGVDQQDLFGTEYIGFPYSQGFVRGYNIRSFDPDECGESTTNCPALNQLVGTRQVKLSAEIRVPLLGPERIALAEFRYLPTQLALFSDAGLAWTGDEAPTLAFSRDAEMGERFPVFSVGAATRHNVLGALIVEVYYAYPFQRPDAGGQFGLRFLPGW
jgi:dipeptidyl aminopeptidase/acylaminoacyl peptidase